MHIAFFGSSLVSAYWNGAATYYRGLLRALSRRGHRIDFYEPDAFDRQKHRDIADPEWARVHVYEPSQSDALAALEDAGAADLVVKASGVGVLDGFLEQAVLSFRHAHNLVAFWDVDAPATLERVTNNPADPFLDLIPRYDHVFTYGGGLRVQEGYRRLGARVCTPIYNALDPETHFPTRADPRFTGTCNLLANRLPDRESRIDSFFLEVANLLPHHRFNLGGNGWHDKPVPVNVRRLGHVYEAEHNAFNCSATAVLNVHRESMIRFGHSPATRLFEAAGAGACLVTDAWAGIEDFFDPGKEILVAADGEGVAEILQTLSPQRAFDLGELARKRALAQHTYERRARDVEQALGIGRAAITIAANVPVPAPVHADDRPLDLAFIGLSITSSWGNGHATTYRALLRALAERGHHVSFYERDVPWYADNRDLPALEGVDIHVYKDLQELEDKHGSDICSSDLAVVGSYVPQGTEVIDWLCQDHRGPLAFYDIDTPVTLEALRDNRCEYLLSRQVRQFDLYLSFSGGRALELLSEGFGARRPRPLYCSFDPGFYRPVAVPRRWALNYMGTYSLDRQPALEKLLFTPAIQLDDRRFAVAGPKYPGQLWPRNVDRIEHLAPDGHPSFYASAKFTLNVTRAAMRRLGWSPSVRLFEAAGCGVPIISDHWDGLTALFEPGREILLAERSTDVIECLRHMSDDEAARIGQAARARALREHTAAARAGQFLAYLDEVMQGDVWVKQTRAASGGR